jgi:hypothetical protein
MSDRRTELMAHRGSHGMRTIATVMLVKAFAVVVVLVGLHALQLQFGFGLAVVCCSMWPRQRRWSCICSTAGGGTAE